MSNELYRILSTRVRRNYTGGALLDGRDGDQPEDWIASTVPACNPGMPPVRDEGITRVEAAGRTCLLTELVGPGELGFVAKLLDSAMRLHVQAHPTAEFAQRHLNSRFGKLEAYVILAVRPGIQPYIRLGFQRAPSRDEWRRIIAEQDIPAMDACFDRIPVSVGDVWVVPGGWPHAIGEGILMLEVMEPTDLVVRCEFERDGISVPPEARFMGRDLDFCLQIFDYESRSTNEVRRTARAKPVLLSEHAGDQEWQLIGPTQTSCFEVRRRTVAPGATSKIVGDGRIMVCLLESGSLTCAAGADGLTLRKLDTFLVPAATPQLHLHNPASSTANILAVVPGAGGADQGSRMQWLNR